MFDFVCPFVLIMTVSLKILNQETVLLFLMLCGFLQEYHITAIGGESMGCN